MLSFNHPNFVSKIISTINIINNNKIIDKHESITIEKKNTILNNRSKLLK